MRNPTPSDAVFVFQQCGAGFGLFYGALRESFKNRPPARPTDKVVLNPVKSDVLSKAMSTMGRQAFMLAAVAAVYSAGEVSTCFVFDSYIHGSRRCVAGVTIVVGILVRGWINAVKA